MCLAFLLTGHYMLCTHSWMGADEDELVFEFMCQLLYFMDFSGRTEVRN